MNTTTERQQQDCAPTFELPIMLYATRLNKGRIEIVRLSDGRVVDWRPVKRKVKHEAD